MTAARAKTKPTTTSASKSPPTTAQSSDAAMLAQLSAELRSKPGTWTILSIALAAVALPAGLLGAWFSREVDGLRRDFVEVAVNAKDAAEASKLAAEGADIVSSGIDSLVVAIARDNAKNVEGAELMLAVQRLLPADLFVELQSGGTLSILRYSDFDNKQWIFVNSDQFNMLTSNAQAVLKESLGTMDVKFHID